MQFTVTIKNNETGEMLVDTGCNAIIGGITLEDTTMTISNTACNGIELAGCVCAAQKAIDRNLSNYPEIKTLIELGKLFDQKEGANNE